ncbi:flavin reductase family protein [Cupriavidus basilensis]|uniref:Flavin reductase family protein n=1 Tax=Cupriavidus basilensis TaxID=68895 RepID=A0ABT6AGS4_9BURK|nr:flavin reductase family protein [Cupriavidus basilensis]MDF3831669.1 flavin reductase family protein [Cupriavidus basilensis]
MFPDPTQSGAEPSSQVVPVELAKAYRLLNHGPVTLVTSAHAGRRNVMAASWAMPLDFQPPKVAVVIDARTLTRELVEASGEFVLNIPARAQAAATLDVGSHSGRAKDKFAAAGLATFPAREVGAPLLSGCLGWLECRVIPEPGNARRYDLFIAEVVAAWADPAVFSEGRWHFPDTECRSIHYLSGGAFFATGEGFQVPPGGGE